MKINANRGDFGQLFDEEGNVIDGLTISADTETGEVLKLVEDGTGESILMDEPSKYGTRVFHYAAPLRFERYTQDELTEMGIAYKYQEEPHADDRRREQRRSRSEPTAGGEGESFE